MATPLLPNPDTDQPTSEPLHTRLESVAATVATLQHTQAALQNVVDTLTDNNKIFQSTISNKIAGLQSLFLDEIRRLRGDSNTSTVATPPPQSTLPPTAALSAKSLFQVMPTGLGFLSSTPSTIETPPLVHPPTSAATPTAPVTPTVVSPLANFPSPQLHFYLNSSLTPLPPSVSARLSPPI